MGSSMAENHPVGFRWVIEARERGATIIHIDPRFTRTSAMADMWAPLRAGTDTVFLGALVNYVLANRLEFREYVTHYTNAANIVRADFLDTEDLAGLFSGWDAEQRQYATASWAFERGGEGGAPDERTTGYVKMGGGDSAPIGAAQRDETLEHPRCVYQVLKRHYAR